MHHIQEIPTEVNYLTGDGGGGTIVKAAGQSLHIGTGHPVAGTSRHPDAKWNGLKRGSTTHIQCRAAT